MAEGYLRQFAGDRAVIYSAGVETHGVNPLAVQVMKEDGIDISGHTSNNLNEYLHIRFDIILTVCDNAKERCPFFPSENLRLHHNFPDPAKAKGTTEEVHAAFIYTRNLIREFCKELTGKFL
jgi:arsenate reductase